RDAIHRANQRRSTMIVLQLDSGGSVDVDVEPLLRDVRASRVPVVVWVGPSGASIGPADPLRLDQPGATNRRGVTDRLAALAVQWDRNGAGARRLAVENLPADAAQRRGAINTVEPTVGELI